MAFQALNWKEKQTTPWGTSADFVPHRSCFWTQSSLGSVQIQYQTLDTNDCPWFWTQFPCSRSAWKGKIMWLSLTQDKQLTAETAGPKGMYFTLQQIISNLGCLFSPPPSQRNRNVLPSSDIFVSEERGQEDCDVWSVQNGNLHLTATTAGQVGGKTEILAGTSKDILYLASWLRC